MTPIEIIKKSTLSQNDIRTMKSLEGPLDFNLVEILEIGFSWNFFYIFWFQVYIRYCSPKLS